MRVKFRRDCTFLEAKRHWYGTLVECVRHGKNYKGCVDCKDFFGKPVEITSLFRSLINELKVEITE